MLKATSDNSNEKKYYDYNYRQTPWTFKLRYTAAENVPA